MNATAIIIPAHNEETALPHLLQQLSTRQKSTIIIDDGSTDSTFHIANKSKCHVLKNKQRQGVSQSIREGLEYALQAGFDKAVCIDADGQHDVTFLDLFEKRLQEFDFVIGNRFYTESDVPDVKRTANLLGAKIINRIFNTSFTDVSCGFRGIHITPQLIDVLKESNEYSIIFDTLIYALENKKSIGIVKMPAIYDPSRLYTTSEQELKSFIFAINRIEKVIPDNLKKPIDMINRAILENCDFYITLDEIKYYGFYISRANGYIIQSSGH